MHWFFFLSVHTYEEKQNYFSSHLLLTFLSSGVRWRACTPEAWLPGQTIVPHHDGSHCRRRSLLPGGTLHGSPAQEVTKNKQNSCALCQPAFENTSLDSEFGFQQSENYFQNNNVT